MKNIKIFLVVLFCSSIAHADYYRSKAIEGIDEYAEKQIEDANYGFRTFTRTMHTLMSKVVFESMPEETVIWKQLQFIGLRDSYVKQDENHKCVGSYNLPNKTDFSRLPYTFSCRSTNILNDGRRAGQMAIVGQQYVEKFLKELALVDQTLLYKNTFENIMSEKMRDKLFANYDVKFIIDDQGASLTATSKKDSDLLEKSFPFIKCDDSFLQLDVGMGEFEDAKDFLQVSEFNCEFLGVRDLQNIRNELLNFLKSAKMH